MNKKAEFFQKNKNNYKGKTRTKYLDIQNKKDLVE